MNYTNILNHWATHVLVIFNHLYIIRMPNPLPFHPKFSTLITTLPSQFSTNPSTPRNPLVIFLERPPPLTLILTNPIDTWPGEKGATRMLAVVPGDRDMVATPPLIEIWRRLLPPILLATTEVLRSWRCRRPKVQEPPSSSCSSPRAHWWLRVVVSTYWTQQVCYAPCYFSSINVA